MKEYFKSAGIFMTIIGIFGIVIMAICFALYAWIVIDCFIAYGFWKTLFITSPAWGISLMAYSQMGVK